MFKTLRLVLLPLFLIPAAMFVMSAWTMTTTLHHRLTWPQTSATLISAELAPTGRAKYGNAADLFVTVKYGVAGETLNWSGFGKDIGVYDGQPGDRLILHYNPGDPSILDTAHMKGWRGGLLLLAVTGGMVLLYLWFFWLRGGPAAPPPAVGRRASRGAASREFGLR